VEGGEAIPDFTRLMAEAEKRASIGLLQGSGLKTFDEISDKLDPYDKPVIEADVEGEVLLAQEESAPAPPHAAGDSLDIEEDREDESMEIVEMMMGLRGIDDASSSESSDDEKEQESIIRVNTDEDAVMARRFDPVHQENWRSLIRWGNEGKDDELEETELSYARWNGHAAGRRRPFPTRKVRMEEEREEEGLENGHSSELGALSESEEEEEPEMRRILLGSAVEKVDPLKTAEELLSNGALGVLQGGGLTRDQWVPYIAWDDTRWRRLWRGLLGEWDPRRVDMDYTDPYINQETPQLSKPNLEALGLTGSGSTQSREADVLGKKKVFT